jgi:hypothetical protein
MEKETWQQMGEAPSVHSGGTRSDSFINSFMYSVINPKWTRYGRSQLLSSFITDDHFPLNDCLHSSLIVIRPKLTLLYITHLVDSQSLH